MDRLSAFVFKCDDQASSLHSRFHRGYHTEYFRFASRPCLQSRQLWSVSVFLLNPFSHFLVLHFPPFGGQESRKNHARCSERCCSRGLFKSPMFLSLHQQHADTHSTPRTARHRLTLLVRHRTTAALLVLFAVSAGLVVLPVVLLVPPDHLTGLRGIAYHRHSARSLTASPLWPCLPSSLVSADH